MIPKIKDINRKRTTRENLKVRWEISIHIINLIL